MKKNPRLRLLMRYIMPKNEINCLIEEGVMVNLIKSILISIKN